MNSFGRFVLHSALALAVAAGAQTFLRAHGLFPANPAIAATAAWGLSFLFLVPVFMPLISRGQLLDEDARRCSADSESLDGLKDQFLSHVSHEFRSPLATIMGYLDLLSRPTETLSARHADYVRTMRQSAQRLKTFVDNIIDLSKLDAGVMEYVPGPLDVREVLETSVQALQSLLDTYRLSVRLQCPANLCAQGDADLVRKVAHQVLINAINFTAEKGHITVWAKDGGQQSVLMGVTDTGIGIPRAMFERIFEKFEQVKETKDKIRKTHGTGLGLPLAKRLVELQGGRIWVQSSSRRGSTIAWVLPKPARRTVRMEARDASRDSLAA